MSANDRLLVEIVDQQGRTFVLVPPSADNTANVRVDELGKDVYVVVAHLSSDDPAPLGWISGEQVAQAPLIGEVHAVPLEVLRPIPEEFDFNDPCPHEEEFGALWDDRIGAWECCGCGWYRLDRRNATIIAEYNRRFLARSGHPVLPGAD